jgi:hypothetical protein
MNLKNRYLMLIVLAVLKSVTLDFSVDFGEIYTNLNLIYHENLHLVDTLVGEEGVLYDKIHRLLHVIDPEKNAFSTNNSNFNSNLL